MFSKVVSTLLEILDNFIEKCKSWHFEDEVSTLLEILISDQRVLVNMIRELVFQPFLRFWLTERSCSTYPSGC